MTDIQKSQARSMYQKGLRVDAIAELVGALPEQVENHLIDAGLHWRMRPLPSGPVCASPSRLAAENRALRPALEALIEAAAEAGELLERRGGELHALILRDELRSALAGARAALAGTEEEP